ncbi:cobalamin B12-binding domain-containing protein [Archangium lansingense]|uniref:Cobalamin-dependent protein n=1 Tax=Archangium lansingense TaxID=2995310 RepID=A0ABT3ZUS8_9BACT|nr:cobalamin-dependent protein [Archangium lansinium]MCY1073155.1 cobalamin-dependent protein [Archangium lansinium]
MTTDTLATLRESYLSAQLSGNRREALRLLVDEGVLKGLPLPSLHLEVIQKTQWEIGRKWQENEISVAQEHMATAISQLALSHLYRHLPRDPPNGRRVMVACVEGELHELGARMASDFLEMAGFDVRFLGASIPTEHLAREVRESNPDLLALSVTMTYHIPALRQAVTAVREVAPRLPMAVGGLAFTWVPGVEAELGVPFFGKDARELVASACRMFEV